MNIGQAKAIPIDRLLAHLGFSPAFERKGELWYKSPFRPVEAEPSFHVTPSRLGWKDFGNGERGGNILDFVMLYYDLGNNLSAALRKLGDIEGQQPSLFAGEKKQASPAPASTPQPPPPPARPAPTGQARSASELEITKLQVIAHPALIGYLNTRGISGQLARQYLKEVHFTQHGKSYFALGFANNSGGQELRNPYYQGSTPPKDITSIQLARVPFGGQAIAVFEGFFDYLSAIATRTLPEETPAIILNSAALKERALTAIRQARPSTVHLYLDRDATGQQLAAYFRQHLNGIEIHDQSGLYDNYKDFNEMHQAQQKQQRSQGR